ncbi:hypothetical protein T08_12598 [Trichinella sp. T8]|nr:hypothetical protein T08_12598 [Trichinella sp. T8]
MNHRAISPKQIFCYNSFIYRCQLNETFLWELYLKFIDNDRGKVESAIIKDMIIKLFLHKKNYQFIPTLKHSTFLKIGCRVLSLSQNGGNLVLHDIAGSGLNHDQTAENSDLLCQILRSLEMHDRSEGNLLQLHDQIGESLDCFY